jgi:hypothetical protein
VTAKRAFAGVPPVPDFITKLAAEAPGGDKAPVAAPQPPAEPVVPPEAVEKPQRPGRPRREASQTMSVKVPKGMYDELREFWKDTDITMTEVLVEGGRKELARLKAKYGIDG